MQFSLPILIGLALADALNPVLMSRFIQALKSAQKHTAISVSSTGIAYISAIFIGSLSAGFALSIAISTLITLIPLLVFLIGIYVIILGTIDILITLNPAIIHHLNSPLLRYDLRLKKNPLTHTSSPTLLLSRAIITTLLETILSRGIYIALIATSTIQLLATPTYDMLALYNLIMILPYVLLMFMVKYHLPVNQFIFWNQKSHFQTHLGKALLTLILGLWLIF